jgi:hypothetical protein
MLLCEVARPLRYEAREQAPNPDSPMIQTRVIERWPGEGRRHPPWIRSGQAVRRSRFQTRPYRKTVLYEQRSRVTRGAGDHYPNPRVPGTLAQQHPGMPLEGASGACREVLPSAELRDFLDSSDRSLPDHVPGIGPTHRDESDDAMAPRNAQGPGGAPRVEPADPARS